ncbi:MAG: aldose epimerase family protein [Pseudomonadota bacterium]
MAPTPFGTTTDGKAVDKITLSAGDLTVALLTWGAVVQSVRLAGVGYDLSPGSDLLAEYEGQMRHHGSLIGPVVNRLTGASAPINGQTHRFAANQDGQHTLHGGAAGTHLKVWHLADHSATHATLTLTLPDGEGGFPGNRTLTARFTVLPPATLRLEVTATTDAHTLVNAANHSYWNLDGTANWAGHSLRIAADHYLPTTDDFCPTGEVRPVAHSDHDFRKPRAIAPGAPLLDNAFCLSTTPQPLRDVLWLTGQSGVRLTVATTERSVQVYDGRHAIRPGHTAHEGLAIEAQGWPDAPNHAGFPSIELTPDQTYQQTTEWRLSRR